MWNEETSVCEYDDVARDRDICSIYAVYGYEWNPDTEKCEEKRRAELKSKMQRRQGAKKTTEDAPEGTCEDKVYKWDPASNTCVWDFEMWWCDQFSDDDWYSYNEET